MNHLRALLFDGRVLDNAACGLTPARRQRSFVVVVKCPCYLRYCCAAGEDCIQGRRALPMRLFVLVARGDRSWRNLRGHHAGQSPRQGWCVYDGGYRRLARGAHYIVDSTSQQRRCFGELCDARYSLPFDLNARSYRFILPVLQEEGCTAWCPLVVAWVPQLANRK